MLIGTSFKALPNGTGPLDGPRAHLSRPVPPSTDGGAGAVRGTTHPGSTAYPHKAIQSAVAHLNLALAAASRHLDFSVDDATGKTVVRVVDRETGQVVRQIPSAEALVLAARLDAGDTLESLGLDARA